MPSLTPLSGRHGLIFVLYHHHDDLDSAVVETYDLAPVASDDAILIHLCALNARRLRPAFPNPINTATLTTLTRRRHEQHRCDHAPAPAQPVGELIWPKTLAEQAQAVRSRAHRADRRRDAGEDLQRRQS